MGNRKHNHCNLSQEAIEWINGELLGDGSLNSRNPCSARFMYASKYLEYIQYVENTLKSFGIRGGRTRKHVNKKRKNTSYRYASLRYSELYSIWRRWYPRIKKIVPRNIKLTPLVCRQWFIGDGSLLSNTSRSCIRLSTCGFTILDVKWLVSQLTKLGFKTTIQPSKNEIYIFAQSTKEFLKYLSLCPVKCYKYKWNYQDNRRRK